MSSCAATLFTASLFFLHPPSPFLSLSLSLSLYLSGLGPQALLISWIFFASSVRTIFSLEISSLDTSDREAVMDEAGAEGGNEDKPAETAVRAFVANNLHNGSNWGSWKPLEQGWKKRAKKEPR